MTLEREAFYKWWGDEGHSFTHIAWRIWQDAIAWKAEQAQSAQSEPLTDEEIGHVVKKMNADLTGFRGWGWLDLARAVLKAQREKT